VKVRDNFYLFRSRLKRYVWRFIWRVQVKNIREFDIDGFSNLSRNDVYKWFSVSFRRKSPEWLKCHRQYFSEDHRGFGEDAFHAMWYFLLETVSPSKLLEIGVYRGQVTSLWKYWAMNTQKSVEIVGVTPLSMMGDSVSVYPELDYKADIEANFKHFNLEVVEIIPCLSQESPARERIVEGLWDLIYIDGSHEYEDVRLDVESAYLGLRTGGLLVLDDSSLYTDFQISLDDISRGHPGPSLVFMEMDRRQLQWVFGVGHINVLRKL
jgi:hypothetical protein